MRAAPRSRFSSTAVSKAVTTSCDLIGVAGSRAVVSCAHAASASTIVGELPIPACGGPVLRQFVSRLSDRAGDPISSGHPVIANRSECACDTTADFAALGAAVLAAKGGVDLIHVE